MKHSLEPHQRPNRSRLEKWRTEITEMRSLDWPFRKISQWLLEEHGFQISREAVRQFCKLRGITKEERRVPLARPTVKRTANRSSHKTPKLFEYDGGDEPITLPSK